MINNLKNKKLTITIMVAIMALITLIFVCNIPTASAETNPSNFVTTRTTGTLNGTLQKHPNGSITFDGNEIAGANENLSQMYIILQGAGGAGGNRFISHKNNGGGSGAFALVLVKFKAQQDTNGYTYYLPVRIHSGYGGQMSSFPNYHLIRQESDSSIMIDNIGSISATAGLSAVSSEGSHTPGGKIIVNPIIENMNDYMEIKYRQEGKTSSENNTSRIFTLNMYKNGGWLTTKTFGTHLGGSTFHGGGASPYSKGGNGAYFDLLLIWSYPENAPSYGAGGGGTNPIFMPTDPNCNEVKYGTGGNGGNGFVEILG